MNILGIRFRAHGQTYFFSTAEPIELNSMVVVETEQGLGIGEVVSAHDALPASIEQEEVRSVLRLAHAEDLSIARANEALAKQALTFCQECIRSRKLDMKLVDVEVYYDRTKIIFYFTAPARIDFRELVKDLVREYRSRIELRQIGVRHETQMVGAVGNCGMVCCCRRFLRKFAPVTIRMAKEQNLFLNPAKISGICGRLLCCLSYEQENYDAFHRNCPRLGKKYQTSQGSMKVLRANMFRNTLSVLNENNEELEFSLDDWQGMEPHRPEQPPQTNPPLRVEKSPQHQQAHDGLLVLTVTPETVDDPYLFDDMLPPHISQAGQAAQAAQMAQSAQAAQMAQTAQAAQMAQSAQAAQMAQAAQAAQMAQSAQAAQMAQSAQAAQMAQSAQGAQTAQSAQAAQMAQSAQGAQSVHASQTMLSQADQNQSADPAFQCPNCTSAQECPSSPCTADAFPLAEAQDQADDAARPMDPALPTTASAQQKVQAAPFHQAGLATIGKSKRKRRRKQRTDDSGA